MRRASASLERMNLEFPDQAALSFGVAAIFGVALAVLVARVIVSPIVRAVLARAPRLDAPLAACGVLLVLAWLALLVAGERGLGPIHLRLLAGASGLGALACALLASRCLVPNVGSRYRVPALGALGALLVFAFSVSTRDGHASFLLYDRCLVGGPLAGALRDALDFDRDGACATWVGGADCAEGDASRGPAQREIPGDGIDQDCRGGDAPARPAAAPAAPLLALECAKPAKRSVILISVDALRLDVLSRKLTPNLILLASQSLRFTHAYTQMPETSYAIASLFSGRAVSDVAGGNFLISRALTLGTPLPEELRRAGYKTASFNHFGLPDVLYTGIQERNPMFADVYPRTIKQAFGSAQLTDGALAFAARHREEPFFVWVHYPDAHAPYLRVPSSKFAGEDVGAYEQEVAYVDFHIGRLLDGLAGLGVAERAVVVLTADHGEELGQHGREGHGPMLYESSVRVPLFLRIPECAPRAFTEPVGLARVASTVSALVGVPGQGVPLVVGDSDSPAVLPLVVESVHGGAFKRAIIGPHHKLMVDVRSGGRVLFDLARDPEERTDIARAEPEAMAALEAAYQRWLDR
jgi:arylsulfatase A-like enzyme